LTLAGNGRTGRKKTCGKGNKTMTSGRLEPDDREGPGRNSAWSQQGDKPQSEIDGGSNMQELMERVTKEI
jgi:hypothetical protein